MHPFPHPIPSASEQWECKHWHQQRQTGQVYQVLCSMEWQTTLASETMRRCISHSYPYYPYLEYRQAWSIVTAASQPLTFNSAFPSGLRGAAAPKPPASNWTRRMRHVWHMFDTCSLADVQNISLIFICFLLVFCSVVSVFCMICMFFDVFAPSWHSLPPWPPLALSRRCPPRFVPPVLVVAEGDLRPQAGPNSCISKQIRDSLPEQSSLQTIFNEKDPFRFDHFVYMCCNVSCVSSVSSSASNTTSQQHVHW